MDTNDRTISDTRASQDASSKSERGAMHVDITATTVAFALSRGMTMREIEAATGLHGPSLGDPLARLPDDIAPRLWASLIERSGDSVALTIEAARAAPFTVLGGLVHGLRYAADLEEALRFFIKNSRVLADRLQLDLRIEGEEAMMFSTHPSDCIDTGRTAEVGVFQMVRVVRHVLQQRNAIKRVEVLHQPLGPAEEYEAFARAPVLFGRPNPGIVFHANALSAPVPGRNAELFAYVAEHFALQRQRLEGPDIPAPLTRLHHAIAEGAASGDYRAATAAARAELTLRAAQRIAALEGTTLQRMIEKTRQTNAETLLANRSIPIETVASLLGYSDDRAFRRAFRRWTGFSPSEYRRRNR